MLAFDLKVFILHGIVLRNFGDTDFHGLKTDNCLIGYTLVQ